MSYWPFALYTIPFFATTILTLLLGAYVWRRRSSSGAVPLAVMLFASALWSAGYALELNSTTLTGALF